MKKLLKILKIIIILFILFVALIVSVTNGYIKFTEYRYTKAGYYVGHGAIFAEGIGKLAADTKDPSKCEKIKLVGGFMEPTEYALKDICYYGFSQSNEDESLCSLIPNELGYGTGTTPESCRIQARANNQI